MEEAEFILSACRQFHCLPSALLAEDSELIRLMTIEKWGVVDDGQ